MTKRYCDFCGKEIPDSECNHYKLDSEWEHGKAFVEFDACAFCRDSLVGSIKSKTKPEYREIAE